MSATCLFIGGAKHPNYLRDEGARKKQQCMLDLVQDDFRQMLGWAAERAEVLEPGKAHQIQHNVVVQKMLVNSDIAGDFYERLPDSYQPSRFDGKEARELKQRACSLLEDEWCEKTNYASKEEVRRAVQDFVRNGEGTNLILFMTGHGQQKKRSGKVVEESFLLPMPGGVDEPYTDAELTHDVEKLSNGKRLYIVCHSCHSGGMINFWNLDQSRKWVVIFASAEADILVERQSGFVESFRRNAEPGEMLCDIAGKIQKDTCERRDGHNIRPAFICICPEYGKKYFLL